MQPSDGALTRPAPIRTRVSELLGIDYPIVQGGLAYLSLAPLAAAVSAAGGLGQIGVAGLDTPEDLRAEIAQYRTLSARPFGVNFPIGIKPMEAFLEVALAEGTPVVSFTGGNPEALLRRTQAVVAGVRAARKAEDLGADAVIAVGFEGGGHLGRDDLGTLVLVPRIADAVHIPVLASGGIADGRGFAAALALGATGVELGTRFVAVAEGNAHDAYKAAIVAAGETDTVIIERSIGRPARVLRSPFVERLLALEDDLARRGATREEALPEVLPFILGDNNTRAAIDGDLANGFVWGGQVVGLINDIPTTAELLWRMVREARSLSHTMAAL